MLKKVGSVTYREFQRREFVSTSGDAEAGDGCLQDVKRQIGEKVPDVYTAVRQVPQLVSTEYGEESLIRTRHE
jgi:hypothetical protein